jgi:eukaryotic-like serine/threonine-protein kinase
MTRDVVSDRFEIDRVAGAGGMGTVYRAIDRQTGAPVALKVINAGHGAELAERFQREVSLLAELHHPGIVRFVASGTASDGQPFMAMEWLDGEGLSARLARGLLSVAEAVELGWRVASALAVAHARGIIHRDLKPGNLFLPAGDLARVVILDFGIARVIEGGQSLTSTGATLGSPGYLSPEQARGQKNLDTRADVFSLGCVLFKCLTGQAPFTGDLIQVMMKTVMAPAPLVGSLRIGIPPAVEDLIQRMLSKAPERRPRDAAAVAAELAALAPSVGASMGASISVAPPPAPVAAPRPVSRPPVPAAPSAPPPPYGMPPPPAPGAGWSTAPPATPTSWAPPPGAMAMARPSLTPPPAPVKPPRSRTLLVVVLVVAGLVLVGIGVTAFLFSDAILDEITPASTPAAKHKGR